MKKILIASLLFAVITSPLTAVSRADDSSSDEILRKLNEISETQKQLMESLEQVKAELQIVKVRVTSR